MVRLTYNITPGDNLGKGKIHYGGVITKSLLRLVLQTNTVQRKVSGTLRVLQKCSPRHARPIAGA